MKQLFKNTRLAMYIIVTVLLLFSMIFCVLCSLDIFVGIIRGAESLIFGFRSELPVLIVFVVLAFGCAAGTLVFLYNIVMCSPDENIQNRRRVTRLSR
jgi:hypothetical protein